MFFKNKIENYCVKQHHKNKKDGLIEYFDGDIIIDDYQINTITLQKIFREFANLDSLAVYNKEGLLKLLNKKIPKNIWLDISLGDSGLDGIKIIKLLRKKYKFKGNIFAYMGIDNKLLRKELKKIGVNYFLIKPVSQEKIMEVIKYRINEF